MARVLARPALSACPLFAGIFEAKLGAAGVKGFLPCQFLENYSILCAAIFNSRNCAGKEIVRKS